MLNQVIVTGRKVSPELASRVRHFLVENGCFAVDWCHPTGVIGYIDAVTRPTTSASLQADLQKIAVQFPTLTVGVSYMSGPPGEWNAPEVSWYVNEGKVEKSHFPHMGHKPPQRWKP